MQKSARVVVIGGGAVGVSCLWHLAQAGVGDCLLIERDELTSGSTWHAAGNIPIYATSWLGMRAGAYARHLYGALGEDVSYHHTGAFWPAHGEDRMDLYRRLAGLATSAGVELVMITPGEMEALHPHFSAGPDIVGGILDPGEGDIDPAQLTQTLARQARKAGAAIERFTRVTGLSATRSGEWRVTTDKGEVTTQTIVNAAGFYGGAVARLAGQSIPVATLKHQYLVTEPLPVLMNSHDPFPLVRDPDLGFYLRREGAGMLLGSYDHPGRPVFADGLPQDFAHQLFSESPDDIAEAFGNALGHFPLLREAGIRRFVNGPIAYAPDALPLCGPAYGLKNFFHACGIQIGITHSAAAGKAIAEWISEGETEWDMAAWDPRRFGNWATGQMAVERAVEVYGLQYAIPYPRRLLSSSRPMRTTTLYGSLASRGAVFGEIGGWERAFWFDIDGKRDDAPLSFRDREPWRDAVRRECEGVRDAVGIMDHGGFSKFEVKGPDATRYLERVFCGRIPETSRTRLAYMLTPSGRIWSEATITRLGENHYLLCGPTLAEQRDHDWLREALPSAWRVELRRGCARDATLMLAGPRSRDLLASVTDSDLGNDAMPWLTAASVAIAGCRATALRVSYAGELGWELHLASADLQVVHDALRHYGQERGLVDFGSWALDSLRLEKGYHAWGLDIGTEYTPFDAGLDRFIAFDREDFIGRDAVVRQRQTESTWRFTGFVIADSDADALPGDPILVDSVPAGHVTSAGTGFRTMKRLALGYVRSDAPPGNWSIRILGKDRPATLSPLPFYDPGNARLKA